VELNRNHYFMTGIVLLFLGIQLRMVDAYVLTKEASDVVTKQLKKAKAEEPQQQAASFFSFAPPPPPPMLVPKQHKLKPPRWIGWALVSAGAVLILHSLAMKRPGA
jgi:hypothetical protein